LSQVQLTKTTSGGAGSAPLLEVKNLVVVFHKETGFLGRRSKTTRAVDNVSFELNPNETLSIVGESGSGKTTVARCVTALNTPTSGTVKYCGNEVTELRSKDLLNYRKEVQIVFQDPFGSLNPFNDVSSVVSTPLKRLLGMKDPEKITERVLSLLVEVGLEPTEVLRKLPHQLSGGERQRVNIARALASEPKILVADEPVSMLDASQRLNTLYLLKEIQAKRGISILMITHDLATSRVMGGRTAVMYLGKMFEQGPTEQVLTASLHPYTELLILAAPKADFAKDNAVELYGSTIEKSEKLVGGCVFRSRCKYATQICSDIEPPLEPKFGDRLVACHNFLGKKSS
jgi:peptide/nickel transport system ATP-binding protein